jgi:hypothetical protein
MEVRFAESRITGVFPLGAKPLPYCESLRSPFHHPSELQCLRVWHDRLSWDTLTASIYGLLGSLLIRTLQRFLRCKSPALERYVPMERIAI